jgi:starch synthase
MRIAHVAAEVSPLAKTGGLGEVVGALPAVQQTLGHDLQVWMPYYREAREYLLQRGLRPDKATDPFTVTVGGQTHQVAVLRTALPGAPVPLFMVACDRFFDRPHLYDAFFGQDDGLTRFTLFCRAATHAMKRMGTVPDIIHAHDWHAAALPISLALARPRDDAFQETATVFTVHNMAFQGLYNMADAGGLGIPPESTGRVEWGGALNLLKGALETADVVTTVSPSFAREVATPEGGFGLDTVVRGRHHPVVGVLNGINDQAWDPRHDRKIAGRYDQDHPEDKEPNRAALLSLAGMDKHDRGLVAAVVGRLTHQKGLDLLFPALADLVASGVRVVVLGEGDPHLEDQVIHAARAHRGRFWGFLGYSDELAHVIVAGADALLMPSRFEPCGLTQMYGMAYGTLPVARRVGGLLDTVVGFDGTNADQATGFSFDEPDPQALLEAVRRARQVHQDPATWRALMRNGMTREWGWRRPARAYLGLYQEANARRHGW